MANFRIGPKMVCVDDTISAIVGVDDGSPNPKLNEILTIINISGEWLKFKEYSSEYSDDGYRPLADDFADKTLARIQEGIQEIKELEEYLLIPERK